jgi:hypothetical protein
VLAFRGHWWAPCPASFPGVHPKWSLAGMLSFHEEAVPSVAGEHCLAVDPYRIEVSLESGSLIWLTCKLCSEISGYLMSLNVAVFTCASLDSSLNFPMQFLVCFCVNMGCWLMETARHLGLSSRWSAGLQWPKSERVFSAFILHTLVSFGFEGKASCHDVFHGKILLLSFLSGLAFCAVPGAEVHSFSSALCHFSTGCLFLAYASVFPLLLDHSR